MLPVVTALVAAGVHVSIDTMRAEVARECVIAGACIVNDVSGGLADQAMYAAVAQLDVPYVIMHWRGHGSVMNSLASYADVSAEVFSEINERLVAATAAGVNPGFRRARCGNQCGFCDCSSDRSLGCSGA